MSRLTRVTVAVLGLAVLLGGTALPLLALLADEPTPFCCRGRCCCTGETRSDGDGRPCLRVRCGCEAPGAVVVPALLRLEATLPRVARAARSEARWLEAYLAVPSPLDRPDEPPFPPPKNLLPA
jgi:hypothetical protein